MVVAFLARSDASFKPTVGDLGTSLVFFVCGCDCSEKSITLGFDFMQRGCNSSRLHSLDLALGAARTSSE